MTKEEKARYVRTAHRLYYQEGTIEIDDDARVSPDDSGNAYVQAWVYVRDEDVAD